MFERIQNAIQRWLILRQLKRLNQKDVPITLSVLEQWDDIASILVMMTNQATGTPQPVFSKLRDRFPDAQITALMLPEASISVSDSIFQDNQVRFIRIEPSEFNKLGMPREILRTRVHDVRADIAIDLSLSFEPVSALLCYLSGARVKVGFTGPKADLVFNYQLAPLPERDGHERYEVMARYIG